MGFALQENLVHLVRELKEAMKEDGLVLTVAVSPSRPVINQAYDIPSIASHADLVSVISYDFHGPWENYTHHQSGLYAYPEDNGNNLYLNVVGRTSTACPSYSSETVKVINISSLPTLFKFIK